MRESGAVRPIGNIADMSNLAEHSSLQSSLFLMVSLSNHAQCACQ
ncbi:hypothetical protein FHW16_004064 [Phyllobacterium myrsinacearum]|uniref:Uncharacterized protein n=1 Tax=Phyllobacterium myrsinacearum TaxID=28101 RepID=A0A839ES46_9HYPH|nr:hypothetical protein [Phyllobacterium myrsinacearum]